MCDNFADIISVTEKLLFCNTLYKTKLYLWSTVFETTTFILQNRNYCCHVCCWKSTFHAIWKNFMKSFSCKYEGLSPVKKVLKHSKTTIKGLIGGKFTSKWANSKPNFETQNQKFWFFWKVKKSCIWFALQFCTI